MSAEQEIQDLIKLGDWWHDNYVAGKRLMEHAELEMERIAGRVETLAHEAGGVALMPLMEPIFVERQLTLIQGGLSNGSES